MREALFEWLQQSPLLCLLAIAFVAVEILTPSTGINALYGNILAGLIAIPAVIERWHSRHKRDEWLSDLILWLLLGAGLYLYIIPSSRDLASGSQTLTTADYRLHKKHRSRHSYDFRSRYRLEIPAIRTTFRIDQKDYDRLDRTPAPTIHIEYWPHSHTLKRLDIQDDTTP
ncbi:MAG: hypothetical protein ACFN9G_09465 [Cardiobacterium sp.]